MSKSKKIIYLIIALLLIININVYNAIVINPHQIKIREEQISSAKLPKDFKLVFFADLHYGTFFNNENLDDFCNKINKIKADIIVFGGDLIDHLSSNSIDSDSRQTLIDKLSLLEASAGKYAVLGNHDLDNQDVKEEIISILHEAGFETLINNNKIICIDGQKVINLVGIDSLLLGNPDYAAAYNNIDDSLYTITVSHCPDIFENIDREHSDYMLAGHSHGGQVYLPFICKLYLPDGAKIYYKGKYNKNGVCLDITNGVGNTKKAIRFLADSEIVAYYFKQS